MKKFTMLFLSAVFTSSLLYNVQADNSAITVMLNSQKINFQGVQPVMVGDRVMVPIRPIANALKIDLTWDIPTSTMTFNNGKDSIVHKIKESSVLINGVKKDFDYSSIILEERALIPIRMLGESFGKVVDWSTETSTVTITDSVSTAKKSLITSLTTDGTSGTTTATVGNTVTFTVKANANTASVKLIGTTLGLVGSSTSYTTGTSGERIFTIAYKPTTTVDDIISAYSSDDGTNYGDISDESLGIKITSAGTESLSDKFDETVAITKFSVTNEGKIDYGKTVTVDAYTNTGAKTVWVQDSSGTKMDSTTTYEKSGDKYLWTLIFSGKKSGTYYVYSSNDNYEDIRKFTLTVEGEKSSTDLKIDNVTYSSRDIKYEDKVEISAYTTTNASEVWVENSSGDKQDTSTSYYSKTDSLYRWNLSFNGKTSGTYYVYAKDDDGNKVYKTFSLTVDGSSSSSSSVSIRNYDLSNSYINQGDSVTVTAYTDEGADYAWIEDSSGTTVDSTSRYSTSGSRREFVFSFTPSNSGTYYIYARNDNGNNKDSQSFSINFN